MFAEFAQPIERLTLRILLHVDSSYLSISFKSTRTWL